MIRTAIVTAATGDPIDLEEAKLHLRIDIGETAEDDLIMGLIRSSREKSESITGLKLMPQTWYSYYDNFPYKTYIELPYSPVSSIPSSGIYYTKSGGNSTTFSSTKWSQDIVSIPGRVVLKDNDDWPSDTLETNNPIRVEFVCGYAGSTAVPDSIKSAMKLMIGHWYENREESIVAQTIMSIPMGSKHLLAPYRTFYKGSIK